jgi:hypothetical protein
MTFFVELKRFAPHAIAHLAFFGGIFVERLLSWKF